MTEFQVVIQERMFPPLKIDRTHGVDGLDNGWRFTLDGSLAQTVKLAFMFLGTLCLASWSPLVFGAAVLGGCYFGDKLSLLDGEAYRFWSVKVETADGKENHMRKVALGASLACAAALFPVLGALCVGQYVGRRLHPYLGVHLAIGVALVSRLFSSTASAGQVMPEKKPETFEVTPISVSSQPLNAEAKTS